MVFTKRIKRRSGSSSNFKSLYLLLQQRYSIFDFIFEFSIENSFTMNGHCIYYAKTCRFQDDFVLSLILIWSWPMLGNPTSGPVVLKWSASVWLQPKYLTTSQVFFLSKLSKVWICFKYFSILNSYVNPFATEGE